MRGRLLMTIGMAFALAGAAACGSASTAAQRPTTSSLPPASSSVPSVPDGKCIAPPRATKPGPLPADGSVTVGGVSLPAGHRRSADPTFSDTSSDTGPALWITDAPVTDAATTWLALADRFPTTGLWPVIASNLDEPEGVDPPGRPWDTGEFVPGDVGAADRADAEAVLAEGWPSDEDDPEVIASMSPLEAGPFPGLADATASCARDAFATATRSARGRIALVSVARPADVLVRIGWSGPMNYMEGSIAEYTAGMTSVLRSWEDRFGAYVVGIGFDTLTLAVTQPPETQNEAVAIAAEHLAFAPDNIFQDSADVAEYAQALRRSPGWGFWWD